MVRYGHSMHEDTLKNSCFLAFQLINHIRRFSLSRLDFLSAATLSLTTESVDIFSVNVEEYINNGANYHVNNCELWFSQQTILELRYVFNMSSLACLDRRLLSCIAFELL